MSILSIFKTGVADDADPTLVAPAASRIFPVNAFALNGQGNDRQVFSSRALKGSVSADAASATSATFLAQLYLVLGGVWTAVGPQLIGVNSNRLASILFGGVTSIQAN